MSNRALVTGANGGLGKAFCDALERKGYTVIRLLRSDFNLSEVGVALRIFKKYPDVEVLVNNAGFATHGFFTETELEVEREEMMVNMVTLTELTKLYATAMKVKGSGYILNVASTAAYLPGPLMAVYYATKAYVLSLSESLANEFHGSGVSITCLCPGPTQTGFAARAQLGSSLLFRKPMMSEKVAEIGLQGLFKGERVVVSGTQNKLMVTLVRLIPRSMAAKMARRVQEVV